MGQKKRKFWLTQKVNMENMVRLRNKFGIRYPEFKRQNQKQGKQKELTILTLQLFNSSTEKVIKTKQKVETI